MTFRKMTNKRYKKQTAKKSKYMKKTAKKRTWKGKGGVQPPSRQPVSPPPRFMESFVPMGNLSPIRVSTHNNLTTTVDDSDVTPPTSPVSR